MSGIISPPTVYTADGNEIANVQFTPANNMSSGLYRTKEDVFTNQPYKSIDDGDKVRVRSKSPYDSD